MGSVHPVHRAGSVRFVRPVLEVADIVRRHGPAYRAAHKGHLGRVERRVLSAVAQCRTPELGGHIEACSTCGFSRAAYNSCRNRHCPKCQGPARDEWLEKRQADLLPVPYFHVVFTLPAEIAPIAWQNKALVYNLLFDASKDTLKTIAADPEHLGGEIGFFGILHTWGQALTHHPHIHYLIPGGALSPDRKRWLSCKPGFFLPVKVLAKLFRRLFLERLQAAFDAGKLKFHGSLDALGDREAFMATLKPLRTKKWVVYAKPPFGSPEHVLAYLGRYTHRVAIANSRLTEITDETVSFKWRDYKHGDAQKIMTLKPDEFIRRFLLHTLPDGFHRIRHYGFLANGCRRSRLAIIRDLLPHKASVADKSPKPPPFDPTLCPHCKGTMHVIEAVPPTTGWRARAPPGAS
ncbi:MAG: hypothetical protein RL367_1754 [Pseudomonadota bacterium]